MVTDSKIKMTIVALGKIWSPNFNRERIAQQLDELPLGSAVVTPSGAYVNTLSDGDVVPVDTPVWRGVYGNGEALLAQELVDMYGAEADDINIIYSHLTDEEDER